MAIKSKNSGAYADIVGVKVKTAGTYAAVQGIYAKSGGSYESVFSGISEKTFSVTLSGITGATPSSVQAIVTINAVGDLNPIITAHRTSGVAPLSVNFNAALTQINPSYTSIPFHEVRYTWSLGGSPGIKWAYGNKAGIADKNEFHGPVAACLFETPGVKTVTLTAYCKLSSNLTITKSTTVSITVEDPDVVFAGTNTICVSNTALPVAGVDGVPVGADCRLEANWHTAIGLATGGTKRLLFKRGEAWTATADGAIPSGTIGHIGAYGAGADPFISHPTNVRGISVLSGRHDWRITDLEFQSAVSGSSQAENQYKIPIDAISANNLTVARVKTRMSYTALQAQLSNYPAVYDCDFQDTFTTYGNMLSFFYKCHGVSVLGSRLDRSATTHTLRVSGTTSCVIAHNDIKNPGATRQALTMRGWEAPTPITQYVQISDNIIDGGTIGGYSLYCGVVNINTNEELRDVISERNTIVSDSADIPCFFGVSSGISFRNNIVKTLSYAAISVGIGPNVAGAPTPSGNQFFFNNTIYKPNTSISGAWSTFYFINPATGIEIANNLTYAPGSTTNAGQSGGVTAGTMVYTGGPITPSDYTLIGGNTNDIHLNTVRPWAATNPAVIADYAPNSYGVDSGVYVPVFDDIMESLISGTRDMGALQV